MRWRGPIATMGMIWLAQSSACAKTVTKPEGSASLPITAEVRPIGAALPIAAEVGPPDRVDGASTAPVDPTLPPQRDAAPPLRRDAGSWAHEIRFPWRPPEANEEDYDLQEPEDQHRIVFFAEERGAYPVVIAMHGQPRRGESPRNYAFAARVTETAARAREDGVVGPVVVVLPVFRFHGQNWPKFDLLAFRSKIDALLADAGFSASAYYVVGHSGAAGCGGDGMNRAHRMRPAGVGFFDTCLGVGWQGEVRALRKTHTPTLMMHSLETAGFVPRQATEYLPTFDFGLAYEPVGLSPGSCPEQLPDAPLRSQPFRCAIDREGTSRGLIVDSGVGEAGHNALVPIAVRYFLREYVGHSMRDGGNDAPSPRN